MEEKVKYWDDLATYDLEVAKAMLDTEKFLYVGFMCHQCIEKILKAYFQKELDRIPPYTHDLDKLVTTSNLKIKMNEEQVKLLFLLNPLNI